MSTTKTYAPGDTARVRITRNLRGYLRTVLPVGTEAAATYAERYWSHARGACDPLACALRHARVD